jgi:phage baseplate assembly protein gpV
MDNWIKAIAGAQDASGAPARTGIVTSYNGATHEAKVKIQADGGDEADDGPQDTGWLPCVSLGTGSASGFYAALSPGQQVLIVHENGHNENGIVLGTVPSTTQPPPMAANKIGTGGTAQTATAVMAAGEILLVHSSGSVIRMCADGSIYLRGNVNVDGTLRVNGDIFDRVGELDVLRQHYNNHTHGGVQAGGATTATTSLHDPT